MLGTGINRRKRWFDVFGISPGRILFLLGLLACLLALLFGVFLWYSWRASTYDIDLVAAPLPGCTVYDSSSPGLRVAELTGKGRRDVAWSELPEDLIHAFVAREDERFFEHGGVVFSSFVRSMLKNISSFSYQQGASTISMQLARNTYDLRDKSIDRKLLEVALTLRIEEKYDKKAIFTQYLNRIYFGQDCYGIAQAAWHYFGKEVSALDLSESAMLAGIVRGPSIFNPVRDMKAAVCQRNATLDRMCALKMISPELCEKTKAQPVEIVPSAVSQASSYVLMWVRGELSELRGQYGEGGAGINVVTALNLPVQREIERETEAMLTFMEGGSVPLMVDEEFPPAPQTSSAGKRRRDFLRTPARRMMPGRDKAGLGKCIQAAVLCVKASNGNILAVTGGRSPIDGKNRWLETSRPGLAFAPIVFACASDFGEHGMHIVENKALETGRRLGSRALIRYCARLHFSDSLPEGDDLYSGLFPMKRIDIARSLFCLIRRGRDYPLRMVRRISSLGGSSLYAESAANPPEAIPREVARVVTGLLPFQKEGRLTVLRCSLPGNDGQWVLVSGREMAVFLWLGFDEPDAGVTSSRGYEAFMRRCALILANRIYSRANDLLTEQKRHEHTTSGIASRD
ncbi:MAG: transglycosylase domain-containing protein [Akkermansiaceae bacterium]|nr:transglycosylase domain-containing protein [Akkermansiaceae bacterium]